MKEGTVQCSTCKHLKVQIELFGLKYSCKLKKDDEGRQKAVEPDKQHECSLWNMPF